MKVLTEDTIKQIFGNTTFFMGQDYYKNGHVREIVKLEDTLFARVLGSSPEPYEVRALRSPQNLLQLFRGILVI